MTLLFHWIIFYFSEKLFLLISHRKIFLIANIKYVIPAIDETIRDKEVEYNVNELLELSASALSEDKNNYKYELVEGKETLPPQVK